MKKLLVLLVVACIMLSTTIMGIGTVASAVEESPVEDFMIFDGVLEEYIGPGGDVVIPASAGVEEIAPKAFYENKDITSVVIPEGVVKIGYGCFQLCENLEYCELPYSLEVIGSSFLASTAISEVTIPGQILYIPIWAVSNCKNLTKVVLSYGIKEIHHQAFCSNNGLGKVVFPETIELIGGGAFNCQKDTKPVEYIICNPDCEIGYYNDSPQEHANINHEWLDGLKTPFQSSYGIVTYKVVVPRDSAVAEFLKEHEDEFLASDTSNHKDRMNIVLKDEEYFKGLAENQTDYGLQAPRTESNNPGTGNDGGNIGGGDNNPGNTDNPSNGNEGSGNNTNNNNSNNGNSSGNSTSADGNNSVTVAIIVVAGVILLVIIIFVMVIVILFATGKIGGKKKSKAKKAAKEKVEEPEAEEVEENTEANE